MQRFKFRVSSSRCNHKIMISRIDHNFLVVVCRHGKVLIPIVLLFETLAGANQDENLVLWVDVDSVEECGTGCYCHKINDGRQ